MAKTSIKFPTELFGPKLLKLCQEWGKTTVTSWGPNLMGMTIKGRGLKWTIVSTHKTGFTAYDASGRYRWQGKFIEAEEDFDL